jgi:hypothetical protein
MGWRNLHWWTNLDRGRPTFSPKQRARRKGTNLVVEEGSKLGDFMPDSLYYL